MIPDKTVLTKDLISVDLSSKFSFSMKKGETGSVSCVRVHEKVTVDYNIFSPLKLSGI